jgi:hypothetical protein
MEKQPTVGDTVEIRHSNGHLVGEVEFRVGVNEDFGISVDSPLENLVYARTYSPDVYWFNDGEKEVLGEIRSIEVVEE